MGEYDRVVAREIRAAIADAGFENLSPDALRIDVTDSFQRKLGECRPIEDTGAGTDGDTGAGTDRDTGAGTDRDTGTDTDGDPGRHAGEAEYDLRIARRLFEDDHAAEWRDTVRHEVAHAYVFSEFGRDEPPHGEAWKAAARRTGADPSARYEGGDLLDADYVLSCPNGCFERGYLKRSRRIKNPWQYTCGDCEERLLSYDAGDRPSSLEPGTCYVNSLPWRRKDDRPAAVSSQKTRYLLGCPNGCVEWDYQQRSKRIKRPWRYSCPDCETPLVSCDGFADPEAFDPGTCGVVSIQWDGPRITLACPAGCFSVGFLQHSEKTRQPGRYACETCETRLVSYPAGERPAEVAPGTSYSG